MLIGCLQGAYSASTGVEHTSKISILARNLARFLAQTPARILTRIIARILAGILGRILVGILPRIIWMLNGRLLHAY